MQLFTDCYHVVKNNTTFLIRLTVTRNTSSAFVNSISITCHFHSLLCHDAKNPEPSKPSPMATTGRPEMDTYRNSVSGVRGSRNRRQTWRFRTFNQVFPVKVSLEAQVFGRLGARQAGGEDCCPRWCGKLPSIIFTLRTYNIRCLLAIVVRYVTELCKERCISKPFL